MIKSTLTCINANTTKMFNITTYSSLRCIMKHTSIYTNGHIQAVDARKNACIRGISCLHREPQDRMRVLISKKA